MCKTSLRNCKMTDAIVSHTRTLLTDLIKIEWRGNGDLGPALARIARRTGVPQSRLWALLYRPPKDVYASVVLKLAADHEAIRDRLQTKYTAARDATDASSGIGAALTRLAAAIAGGLDQPEEER